MLAPQRGLISTVKSKGNRNSKSPAVQLPLIMYPETTVGMFPELSNLGCLPGGAGRFPMLH